MADIAVIDIIVPPPVVIEIVTGEKGDTGPPGPPGIPGPHAASHGAAGADPVDVKGLAGYPNSTATFLRGDHMFAVPPAGDVLPTAPLGQVLSSQGAASPPVFTSDVLLISPTAGQGWRISVDAGGNLNIQEATATGAPGSPKLVVDPYVGGFQTVYGSLGALNGCVQAKWLQPDAHTLADLMASAARNTVGNLATVSDSTTATPGAVVAGGGTFNVLARWNGTNWIVIGG